MLGHNNPPSPINPYQERFKTACDKLKALGLKGNIALTAGLVMVSVEGKHESQPWRKALRLACKKSGVELVETRPRKGFYVFSIHCV